MNNLEYRIRPLEPRDLNEWLRLRKQLWDETPESDHRDEMVSILENTDSQYVVVADLGGGSLIGFLEASIRPFVEGCETENVGYLEGWTVDEKFRRQGIGRGLVQAAESWARRKGCSEMASDAEFDNDASLKAHSRLGYNEISRLVHLRKTLK